MTVEEMYKILKDLHEKTDWNNLESIKRYNQTARELRKMVEEDD